MEPALKLCLVAIAAGSALGCGTEPNCTADVRPAVGAEVQDGNGPVEVTAGGGDAAFVDFCEHPPAAETNY
jgi:hypothetical protein